MGTRSTVPAGTVLTIVGILAVPLLAVFGLPQLLPVAHQPPGEVSSCEPTLGQPAPLEPQAPARGQPSVASTPLESVPATSATAAPPFPATLDDANSTVGRSDGWSLPGVPTGPPLRPASAGASQTLAAGQPSGRAEGVLDQTPQPAGAQPLPTEPDVTSTSAPATIGSSAQTVEPAALARSAPQPAANWQSAFGQLQRLGVSHFRLEPGHRPGLFFFCCYVQPGGDSRISVRFESEAPDPLQAVQDVLNQVTEWYSQR